MFQLVKFPTWPRIVDGSIRTSSIYHLYTNDQTLISNISSIEPGIEDHLIIRFEIEFFISLSQISPLYLSARMSFSAL